MSTPEPTPAPKAPPLQYVLYIVDVGSFPDAESGTRALATLNLVSPNLMSVEDWREAAIYAHMLTTPIRLQLVVVQNRLKGLPDGFEARIDLSQAIDSKAVVKELREFHPWVQTADAEQCKTRIADLVRERQDMVKEYERLDAELKARLKQAELWDSFKYD